jgi:hypothetical protein
MLARKIDNVLRADGKQFDADTGREDSMASRSPKVFECPRNRDPGETTCALSGILCGTLAAASVYSNWKLRGCSPKVRAELPMKPFLHFASKPEHAAFGIAPPG